MDRSLLAPLLAAALWGAAPVRAQEPPAPASPDRAQTETLRAPALVDFVEAEYPPEAAAAGLEGRVVLRLSLDAEGRVTAADVLEPAGHGFDEAAQAAALRFRFTPAYRGDTPIPARIRYVYAFSRPAPPAVGAVDGRVLLPGRGEQPAVGALVTLVPLSGEDATPRSARTDLDGRFRLVDLPAGSWTLRASAAGIGALELPIAVAEGDSVAPTVRLLPSGREAPLEVTVQGPSERERLRRSAQAVQVIDTEEAKREAADLGEVLARSKGVGVQRSGGLGSGERLSLGGLSGDQVRFFLDGVPLDLSGYPFGLANVPVNLVERVEVYRGVVPIRFGADALGGAVNLVTDDDVTGTHGAASYQFGSFGTHRLTLGARHQDADSGLFVRLGAFYDDADNDYAIDVEVPDARGRLAPERVRRFHDAYRAGGAKLEAGLVDRPWARRLLLGAFVTGFDKALQHNVVMTVPYGEAEYGETTAGATLSYRNVFGERLSVDVLGGYTYGQARFLDVGTCVYDWYGRCVAERRQPGELAAQARDQVQWEHGAFARVHVGHRFDGSHALRLSVSPTFAARTGDERRQVDPEARDPLTAERDLFTLVGGLEYALNAADDRLENVAFFKSYTQVARAEEALPGGVFRRQDRDTQRFGVGNALRYRLAEWAHAKASYEWATRLPRPDEVFGDGLLVVANLGLSPETSHNLNLGVTLDAPETPTGAWRLDVDAFLRAADRLIVLLGNEGSFIHDNVFAARSLGVEAGLGWTSPGGLLALDGNVTWQDFRNASREGTFGAFEGDRIPNRPYLFANGSARLQRGGVVVPSDQLSVALHSRWVHGFYRGWESVGLKKFKQSVPSQLVHSFAATYLVRGDGLALGFTGEIQNLTDAPAYDFFGVQRPGRASFFKVTAEF